MQKPQVTIENCQIAKNKKSGDTYRILTLVGENATNKNAGQLMAIYCNEDGEVYTRELNEFYHKFEIIKE